VLEQLGRIRQASAEHADAVAGVVATVAHAVAHIKVNGTQHPTPETA
jgi:methyl-accepting chemotaxis protein